MKMSKKVPAVLQSVAKVFRHPATVVSRRPLLKGDKDYTPRTKRYKIVIDGSRGVIEKLADDMEVYESISAGLCPDCGHNGFAEIGWGGSVRRFEENPGTGLVCTRCKSRFYRKLPIFAERMKAFTLVELLVVIAIAALLVAIFIPHIRSLIGF